MTRNSREWFPVASAVDALARHVAESLGNLNAGMMAAE
jgi:hypothetical protein